MIIDRLFCMNSYLMYRYIYDTEKIFSREVPCKPINLDFQRIGVVDSTSLFYALRSIINQTCTDNSIALALSSGIDSAILARIVPKGTKAYTFRCIVPGVKVIDETPIAIRWAELNNLDHEIIDIYWEDIIKASDLCMKHKGAPIHSIEAQIYVAAKKAIKCGKTKFIFGENADIIYGGMDGLLSKDWLYSEFVDRFTYVMPYKVLRNPLLLLDPFKNFEKNGYIDGYDFINTYFRQEALGTYINACETAGIEFIGPYAMTYLDGTIDYKRIRSGETKYIVRELFTKLYPGMEIPKKIPMPRPVNEWFSNWNGPIRNEFLPHCTDNMSGDQRWMVWCLERFLNMIEDISYE